MKAIINLMAICFFAIANAHTVWLETETKGKTNQKHEIKIFFGEIEKPTPTAKWFSDIKDLEVHITSPSGKTISTKEKVQKEQYYSAFFVPSEKGTYTISVKHIVKDVFKKMKITYQSIAYVGVDAKAENIKMGSFPLQIEMNNNGISKNKEKTFILFSEGEAKSNQNLKIVADNGWEQKIRTNVKGEATFKPLWKGKYLLELVHSQSKKGNHNGKPYETDYEMITYYVGVK